MSYNLIPYAYNKYVSFSKMREMERTDGMLAKVAYFRARNKISCNKAVYGERVSELE